MATRTSLATRHNGAMQLVVDQEPPPPDYSALAYDYDQVDAAHRQAVQEAALDIRMRERRAAEDLIAIGERLLESKELLPDGKFEEWMLAEFTYSRTMATEFMNVARRFGPILGTLNVPIRATVMRMLAAPSVPNTVIDAVVRATKEEGRPLLVREAMAIRREIAPRPPAQIEGDYTVMPEPEPEPEPEEDESWPELIDWLPDETPRAEQAPPPPLNPRLVEALDLRNLLTAALNSRDRYEKLIGFYTHSSQLKRTILPMIEALDNTITALERTPKP